MYIYSKSAHGTMENTVACMHDSVTIKNKIHLCWGALLMSHNDLVRDITY